MTCIPLERLRRFRLRELPEEERELVVQHLSECRACRRRLVDELRRGSAPGPEEVPDQILERVRGLVDEPARKTVQGTNPAASGTRSRRTWLPLAAAVIALVGAWWLSPRPGHDSEPERVLRDVESVSDRLSAIEPAADAEASGRVRFRWTEVPEASLYRLVILADDGGRLVEHETAEIEIEIDVGALVDDEVGGTEPGREAYWLVEAQLPGGGRLHTDPRPIRLVLAPEAAP